MRSLRRSHWVAFATAAVVLVVLALGGYLRGWDWTGFKGNTLWDWLHLLVLPVTLAFLPLWMQTRTRESRRWRAVLVVGVVAFAVVAVGGYWLGWAWTGFRDNTLWDWLELLVVPFVLPAVLAYLSILPAEVDQPRARDQGRPRARTRTEKRSLERTVAERSEQ